MFVFPFLIFFPQVSQQPIFLILFEGIFFDFLVIFIEFVIGFRGVGFGFVDTRCACEVYGECCKV